MLRGGSGSALTSSIGTTWKHALPSPPGAREEGNGEWLLMGVGVPSEAMTVIWNCTVAMAARHCKCLAAELHTLKWLKW